MAKHLSSIGRHINLIIKSKLSLSIFCTLCIIITYFLRVCNIHTMPKSLTSLTLKSMRQIELVKASTATMIGTHEADSWLCNSFQLVLQILQLSFQLSSLRAILQHSRLSRFHPNIIRDFVFRTQPMLIHILLHQLILIGNTLVTCCIKLGMSFLNLLLQIRNFLSVSFNFVRVELIRNLTHHVLNLFLERLIEVKSLVVADSPSVGVVLAPLLRQALLLEILGHLVRVIHVHDGILRILIWAMLSCPVVCSLSSLLLLRCLDVETKVWVAHQHRDSKIILLFCHLLHLLVAYHPYRYSSLLKHSRNGIKSHLLRLRHFRRLHLLYIAIKRSKWHNFMHTNSR